MFCVQSIIKIVLVQLYHWILECDNCRTAVSLVQYSNDEFCLSQFMIMPNYFVCCASEIEFSRTCTCYRSVTITHSLIHSFTHSLIHSFTHSLIHSFTHSLIHSFTHSLIHSFTHSLIHASTQSLTYFIMQKRGDYSNI